MAMREIRKVYRWDLDKTYLQTEFDSVRDLLRTAFQKAHEKVAVPGAPALIRELKASGDSLLCIISGSPTQMRSVLSKKLELDGVEFDELVLKDNVRNLLRGRFRAVRGQVGYKLPALLESRLKVDSVAVEVLFGDDAEADAFIYSLYADMIARRIDSAAVSQILAACEVYPDAKRRVFDAWQRLTPADPVSRIFIHLDGLTPPAKFSRYGPRLVPVFNYFQAALVLMADGHLTGSQVLGITMELVQNAGHNLLTLSNSFQDLLRRGVNLNNVVGALQQVIEGPEGWYAALRPLPDILSAFGQRLTTPFQESPGGQTTGEIDYLNLLEDARPRSQKGRSR